jgi:drug/metabolite transporter (DMT)-like permease
MEITVFLAVLVAAACHAGWNALLKLDVEPMVATTLLAVASGLISLPLVVALGAPPPAAWPYLAGSVCIHTAYYFALAQAYRHGDLGQVYPIARGSAPLMTALLAGAVLGERLSTAAWAGVIVLAAGILLLALRGGRALKKFDRASVGFALLTSLTITAYTLVDGTGARVAGAPVLYTAWLFVLSAAVVGAWGAMRRGPVLVSAAIRNWKLALGGAALSVAAYVIAIWAMTVAPIALVAALRETSVLFAALFSTLLLREPLIGARIVSACIVLAGALLLRLS